MVDQTPVDRAEDPFSIFKSVAGKVAAYLKMWRGLFFQVFLEYVSLTALKWGHDAGTEKGCDL